MTDIVERLRTFEAWEKLIQRHKLVQDAANEIEHLQKALREIVDWPEPNGVRFQRIAKEALSEGRKCST